MHKVDQNCTCTQKKKPTKCPKFKCNTVSVSFSACRCNSVVLSSRVGTKTKKKESGDISESGICSCGLPACCCQPAVAGAVIYADLWGELSTHLAPQALFTWSSPEREPLLQAFPFPSTGKGDTAPALSGLRVCLQLTWEVGLPPSPVECSSLHHSHKLPSSWLLGMHPCSCQSLSGQPRLVYLQSREGFPSPNLQRSVHPTLFPVCLYCSYCLVLSFSFFPGWRSVCPGGYAALAQGCLWEYRVPLSSPCPRLPRPSGCG
jgi:hypothetical protein